MVPPEPAHHFWQNRPTLLLPVQADAPSVVHVVALFRQCLGQPDVLIEPISLLVVFSATATARAAIIIAAILHEDANRLLLLCQDLVGISAAAAGAAQIGEAAHDRDHLAELIRPLPGDCECGNAARTRAGDTALI